MKKTVALLFTLAMAATPALAQVRPQDCRPVFPLTDPVQAALPQDVFAERLIPATAVKRGFFGLPLLPLLLAGGGCAILCGGGGGGSSTADTPVSPA